eukprot:4197123-Lingulodinium_polyedra.AAC.1
MPLPGSAAGRSSPCWTAARASGSGTAWRSGRRAPVRPSDGGRSAGRGARPSACFRPFGAPASGG